MLEEKRLCVLWLRILFNFLIEFRFRKLYLFNISYILNKSLDIKVTISLYMINLNFLLNLIRNIIFEVILGDIKMILLDDNQRKMNPPTDMVEKVIYLMQSPFN